MSHKLRKLISVLMIPTFFVFTLPKNAASYDAYINPFLMPGGSIEEGITEKNAFLLLKDRLDKIEKIRDKTPKSELEILYEELAKKSRILIQRLSIEIVHRELDHLEWLDYGLAHAIKMQYGEASIAFQAAASSAGTAEGKLGALLAASQMAYWAEDYRRAGQIANIASRLNRNSSHLAAIRYASWKMAGDEIQKKIAEDNIKRIELQLDGREVLEPGTVVVILGLTAALTYVIIKSPSEERTLIIPALAAIASAAAYAVKESSKS